MRLHGELLRIGTAAGSQLQFRDDRDPEIAERHARLERHGDGYALFVEPGAEVWVNGKPVQQGTLASGDVLELGRGGPVVRLRVYPGGTPTHKTLGDVFSDCRDCAFHGGSGPLSRAGIVLRRAPMELAYHTSRTFRVVVTVLLAVFFVTTVQLTRQSRSLGRQLTSEITGIGAVLERSEAIRAEDLTEIRAELDNRLTSAGERLAALEARSEAAMRVVPVAARSVVFLQAAYAFYDRESGRPLRLAAPGPDGGSRVDGRGQPLVGLEGEGPIVESFYTGTAFVVGSPDFLVTGRHVVEPWRREEATQAMALHGFEPRISRFLGYLPGVEEPLELEAVSVSPDADVALLRSTGPAPPTVTPLQLADDSPKVGDGVIVLGYPAGIRALLARTDERIVEQLMAEADLDFWVIARKLSHGGHIGPLASRGIVGQVTSAAVVYDAETTSGGSGGPVLNLEGLVVAVNAAILPEFGGSNLGVPAEHVRVLLRAEEELAPAADARADPN